MEPKEQLATAATPAPEIPTEGLTLEITFASSPAFERAFEIAQKQASFLQIGEGKNLRFRVTYAWTELPALQELKDAAWELHNKKSWVNGQEVPWDAMAKMSWCFHELVKKPKKDHCFFDGNFVSPWGCRYARANFDTRINAAWLHLGRFEQDTFVFDKEKIRAQVWQEIHSNGFHHCPAFDAEFTEKVLELFPERLNPNQDKRWKHYVDPKGVTTHIATAGVGEARKVAAEFQAKVLELRGPEHSQENGKKKIPARYFPKREPQTKKKGLLARVLGK